MADKNLSPDEILLIHQAAQFFEDPGVFVKVLGYTGNRFEDAVKRFPNRIQEMIRKVSTLAIQKCLEGAVKTIGESEQVNFEAKIASEKSKRLSNVHSAATAATGAIGGFLGPQMLIWELPLSTSMMMRSIASTAQEFGFDLNDPEVLMECLLVFAIGGPSHSDDGMETSYIGSKLAFQGLMRAASEAIVGNSAKELLSLLKNQSAPAVVRLISFVASQFGVRVTKKLIVQMTPVIGTLGGATINLAFADYFGKAARHHFLLKKLELTHSPDLVNEIYKIEAENLKIRKLKQIK